MFRGNWRGSGGGGGGGGTALVWDSTSAATYSFSGNTNSLKVDVSSNAVAVTLPAPGGVSGQIFTVKHSAGNIGSNPITISSSSGTIDGLASLVMNQNLSTTRVSSDGTNWVLI